MLTETLDNGAEVETPINIALSLSGGGYRASAFHLGAMQMLHELGLLKNVKMLSTASGGTITAVAYAHSKGKVEFPVFFTSFREFLLNVNVVRHTIEAAHAISENGNNAGKKEKISFIKIAAGLYEKHIFNDEGPTLGDLYGAIDKGDFTDLIFNTTEFKNGLGFRFRISKRPRVIIGNDDYRVKNPKTSAKHIRLSDIIAASSCFPGVFEPFNFPKDFANAGEIEKCLGVGFKGENGSYGSLPLMDGGIYDNQGIKSIMMAAEDYKKMLPEDRIDLIILSDSDARNNNVLPDINEEFLADMVKSFWPVEAEADAAKVLAETQAAAEEKEKISPQAKGVLDELLNPVGKTIEKYFGVGIGISGLIQTIALAPIAIAVIYLAIVIVALYVGGISNSRDAITLLVGGVVPALIFFALIAGAALYGTIWIAQQTTKVVGFKVRFDRLNVLKVGGAKFGVGKFARSLSASELFLFLQKRYESTAVMVKDVFLKNIRRSNSNEIKSHPHYSDRVAFNYIYDLDCAINRDKRWSYDAQLRSTTEMSEISLEAEKYSTNLWFVSDKDLDNLIECGRRTICLSILIQMWDRWAIKRGRIEKFNKYNPKGLELPEPVRPNVSGEYADLYGRVLKKWIDLKKGETECPKIEKKAADKPDADDDEA